MDMTFLITVVVAAACVVLSNLGTPVVTFAMSRILLLCRLRSPSQLEADLADIKNFRTNPEDGQLHFWKQMFLILSALGIGMILRGLPQISVIGIALLAWAAGRAYHTADLIAAIRRGDAFENEARERIERLRLDTDVAATPKMGPE